MPEKSSQQNSNAMSGSVKPGFEAVRQAFVENFSRRNELGCGGQKLRLRFFGRSFLFMLRVGNHGEDR